jgi:hypothetical protein
VVEGNVVVVTQCDGGEMVFGFGVAGVLLMLCVIGFLRH